MLVLWDAVAFMLRFVAVECHKSAAYNPQLQAYQTVDVLLVGKDVVFDRKSKLGGGFGPGYKV